MGKRTDRQPARKKKTQAQIKAARLRNQHLIQRQPPEDKGMKNFSWAELGAYHNECEQMFIVAHPVVQTIRNTELIQQITADGRHADFTALATQLEAQLSVYRTDLDALRASYANRTVSDDNLLEEIGQAIAIAEQYRQWLDSFRTVIVEGLMPDLSDIISTAHAKLVGALTKDSNHE